MSVAVETFECSETASEPIEATEEAVRLMEEMGLAGQMELVRPKCESRPAARSPYRQITEEERFVYETLCPQKVELERYAAGPIPLRVLQIASHVKSLGICKKLQVWDHSLEVVKDPVLVGLVGGSYEWEVKSRLILARWGDVLETFSTLRKQALAMRRERLTDQARNIMAQIAAAGDEEIMKHAEVTW